MVISEVFRNTMVHPLQGRLVASLRVECHLATRSWKLWTRSDALRTVVWPGFSARQSSRNPVQTRRFENDNTVRASVFHNRERPPRFRSSPRRPPRNSLGSTIDDLAGLIRPGDRGG